MDSTGCAVAFVFREVLKLSSQGDGASLKRKAGISRIKLGLSSSLAIVFVHSFIYDLCFLYSLEKKFLLLWMTSFLVMDSVYCIYCSDREDKIVKVLTLILDICES